MTRKLNASRESDDSVISSVNYSKLFSFKIFYFFISSLLLYYFVFFFLFFLQRERNKISAERIVNETCLHIFQPWSSIVSVIKQQQNRKTSAADVTILFGWEMGQMFTIVHLLWDLLKLAKHLPVTKIV